MPALPAQEIIVRYYAEADTEAVKKFYSQTGYRNSHTVQPTDKVVAAVNGTDTVGLYRICMEQGLWVLRGFYVLPAWQHKGVGTLMLYKLTEAIGKAPCYMVCKTELNSFYSHADFKPTATGPQFLKDRLLQYGNPPLNILKRQL